MFTAAPKSAPLPRKQYGSGVGGGGRRNGPYGGRNGGSRAYDIATLSRTKSSARNGGFAGGGTAKYQFVKRKPLFAPEADDNRRYSSTAL